MNKYKIIYEEKARKQIKKLDSFDARQIKKWIEKNLIDTENLYLHGKQLVGNLSKYWRYRVGNYRILAEIDNQNITIIIVSVGHRKEIYD